MSKLLALSLILLSTSAAAQPPTPEPGTKATNPDPDRVICRRQADLSSRLSSRRVCMTEAQWAEYRRETQRWSESVQNPRPD